VKSLYREWSNTAQGVFYADNEKLAISDTMIVSTSFIYQQTPGRRAMRDRRRCRQVHRSRDLVGH
jgi:hypothetical protein